MAQFFEMPQASPTMTTGVLLSWKRKVGDKLAPQDVLAEVETDKAAMEVEVFDHCFLLAILAEEGEEVPAGAPIAVLGATADEDISAMLAEAAARRGAATQAAPTPAAPEPAPAPAPAAPPAAPAAPAAAAPASEPGYRAYRWLDQPLSSAVMEAEVHWAPSTPRLRASPAARRAAREHQVDLSRVTGTGPRGRVTSADVLRSSTPAAPAAQPASAAPADTVVRNSQMRKTIARRLKEVWLDAPVFYLTVNLRCDALVDFRAQLKRAGVATTYNVLLLKAVARALREVPEVNASWGADAITRHSGVHVGVAVALPDGLITPVVRDADQKGLIALTSEVTELAERARGQKLKPEEYSGSTFTISNLGMMEIQEFTAILNPPEACILAVGSLQQEPVVVDGALAVGWRMRVTLTCDHRVVDGALGARFLQAVRRYVEQPALLAS